MILAILELSHVELTFILLVSSFTAPITKAPPPFVEALVLICFFAVTLNHAPDKLALIDRAVCKLLLSCARWLLIDPLTYINFSILVCYFSKAMSFTTNKASNVVTSIFG